MPKNTYYDPKTTSLEQPLFEKLKTGIDIFFLTKRKQGARFSRSMLFGILVEELEKYDQSTDVTIKWLVDLYAGRKTGGNCNKASLKALALALKIEEHNDAHFIGLIEKFRDLCLIDGTTADFAGKYKLFIGGRYQPSIYDIAYDLPMEVFENGIVKIIQTYTKKTYWGLALLRDEHTLEILSFDFRQDKITSVGSFLMFKVNGYKRRQMYFPGVNYSFDSSGKALIYQALLVADFEMGRKHPLVIKYFSETVNNLRMECPSVVDTEELRASFQIKI